MAGALSVGKALGDSLLTFLNGRTEITALALAQIGWQKNLNAPGSTFPPNPYTMCPRLFLRYEGVSLQPGPPRGGLTQKAVYGYSIYYQRRQVMTLGQTQQEHQQLLVMDFENVVSCFTQEAFHPAAVEGVAGFQNFSCVPVQVTYEDELKHDFDDPNLRISGAQMQIKAEGYISSCT